MLLDALVFGNILRNPLRAILTIVAIAVGVGVTLAVALATDSASRAFVAGADALDRHVNLEVFGIGQSLDERIVARVRYLPGVKFAYPVVDGNVGVTGERRSPEILRVRGVDFLQSLPGVSGLREREPATFSPHGTPIDVAAAIANRGAIVSADFARRWDLKPNGLLRVQVDDKPFELRVAGILPRDVVGVDSGTAFVDIATAQLLFGRYGVLDRIDLVVPRDQSTVRERIRALLPAGARVVAPGDERGTAGRFLSALQSELYVLCLVVLVIAATIVYDGMGTSIERRASDIAILRMLGVTKAQLFRVFLVEGLAYGFLGSTFGIALGFFVAGRLEPDVAFDGFTILAVVVAGIGLSGLSAGLAALGAMRIRPALAMASRGSEVAAKRSPARQGTIAVLVLLAGALGPQLGFVRSIPFAAYLVTVGLMLAGAFAVPLVLRGASVLSDRYDGTAGGIVRLACTSLRALPRRAGVATALLAVATSAIVGFGIAGSSFGAALTDWADQTFKADFAIVSARGDSQGDFSPAVGARAARLAGVASVDGIRNLEMAYRGQTITLRGEDALDTLTPGRDRKNATDVSMTGTLAHQLGLRIGDTFPVPSPTGPVTLHLSSIQRFDPRGQATITGPRELLVKRYLDDRVDSFDVSALPSADPASLRTALVRALGAVPALVLTSRELREQALRLVRTTIAIVDALCAICFVMALLSVSSSAAALVFERRRELGLLRYLGATRAKIRQLVLLETAIRSVLGVSLGLALGLAVAVAQLHLSAETSLGDAVPIQISAEQLLLFAALLVVAAIGSAFVPARQAGFVDPAYARGAE